MISRNIFLFFILCFLSNAFAQQTHQIFPDNDLWKEDNCCNKSLQEEETFNRIIDIGYEIYKPLADARGEELVINKKWYDPTVNANCSRWWGTVTINMFGGLARRSEINEEGFALVLCHELGHAYGGAPFISPFFEMSAEGQADYIGAKECHKQVMEKLKLEYPQVPPTKFMEEACLTQYPETGYELCVQGLNGAQSLGNLLAVLKEEDAPNFETPDPLVVEKTELSYPKTTQCRLDTYFNGVMGKDRPLCWFKPE